MVNKRTTMYAVILIVIVAVAAIGAYAYYTMNPAASGDKEFRIGLDTSQTGADALWCDELVKGWLTMVDMINEQGGIKSLNGIPMRVIIRDDKSSADGSIAAAQYLIDVEHVHAMVQTNPDAEIRVSDICKAAQIPDLVGHLGMPVVLRGNEYLFRDTTSAYRYMEAYYEFLNTTYHPKTVAHIDVNVAQGQDCLNATYTWFGANAPGVQIVMGELYDWGTTDVTSIVLRLKAANPDAVFLGGPSAQAILLTRTMVEQGVDIKTICCIGWGFQDSDYPKAVGVLCEDLFVSVWWNGDVTYDGGPAFEAAYRYKYGYAPFELSGWGAHNAKDYYTAAENAKSLNGPALKDALKALDFEGFMYPVKFDANNDNEACWIVVCQYYTDHVLHTVYPSVSASGPIHPQRTWAEKQAG